ncbi:DNA primase [Roseburia sp. BX0805]|uniref:DNA primase n=1 Tax=Roseburia yibonii TaxID=2763063 RepID=A0ABR7I6S1_9FIRM|nr:DNA primase [Roseburia yibonii]MBC5752651.1 DNA primase [Roseburia yibonii]
MPYYSDELIEEVRSRNDIVDVISGYVRLQKKGSTYFGLCPFHNEKTGSFSVSPAKQMYYCFGCGAGGNVFTFLMEYENFTFPEAMQALADRAGIDLPKQELSGEAKRESDKRSRLLEINKEAGKYYYTLLRNERGAQALSYFRKRELSDATMQKFGLGYSDKYSDDLYRYLKSKGYEDEILKDSGLVGFDEKRGGHDKFWNRAMFPIMDIHNKVIGFGGRVMGDGEPKYLNSQETKIFDKSRNLYALNFARQSKRPYMLLCEGYMDVIALHQAGFDNAVASLGTSFTSGHASLLKRYTKEVYLTFDSDGAGIKAALRAIPILKEVGLSAKVINMKPYKDPDEFIKALGAEAYQERIDQAENSFMFEIRILQQDYDMKDPEGKTAFQHETAKKLAQFPEEMERNNYIEAVAEHYRMGYENLRKLVNQYGAQGGLAREPVKLKSATREVKKKEDGMKQSQKLLLTWLIEDTGLFDIVKQYITPEDFTEEIYKKAAEILYAQFAEGALNPGKIVSMFQNEEEQREIAALFNARIHEIDGKQEREKALKETILRVKENSYNYRAAHIAVTDIAGTQKLIDDKRQLEALRKLHISIN